MRREDLWRIRYWKRPYLTDAPADELAQRFADVVNNSIHLNARGQITPFAIDTEYWLELWAHLLEEYSRRGGIPVGLGRDANGRPIIPMPTYPKPPRGFRILQGRTLDPSAECLLKFGRTKYLRETMESGRIRIASAASYRDASFNFAIRDEELSMGQHLLPTEVRISKIDKSSRKKLEDIDITGIFRHVIRSKTDFYIYCMSSRYHYRLIDDFDADAFILFSDPSAFSDRLAEAVRAALPDHTVGAGPVQYFDPYDGPGNTVDPLFWKHFRYAYQSEYRFVWVPPQDRKHMEPIFVGLGPLHDIAELFELEDAFD